ncbi:MAG: hypothetical protein JST10_03865 [Bacteroidetes bacterium]|nr:hypothetical protein [Bacteroidota bacterium]
MKVHLIKTPEYEIEHFNEVYDFLCSFDGPIQFIPSTYVFNASQFEFLGYSNLKNEEGVKKLLFDITMKTSLSWEHLFSLCSYYRSTFNINDSDFVVLLTLRSNTLNWFSHTENKNVFIQTSDWDRYTNSNPKYPIAYQIAENIMQSLMQVDMINIPNDNIHIEPRGCMNDFCENKEQIILKLRTADICQDCREKIEEEKIDPKIANHVFEIFEGIRTELLFKQKHKKQEQPVPIIINEKKQILLPSLGNLEIRLTPLFKTLYIFYLIHNEGVRLADLNDFKTELLSIYRKLSVRDDNEMSKRSIDDLVDAFGNSFSQKKSKINSKITELLGDPLAYFYRIEGERGEPFKINLPAHLIDIRY